LDKDKNSYSDSNINKIRQITKKQWIKHNPFNLDKEEEKKSKAWRREKRER